MLTTMTLTEEQMEELSKLTMVSDDWFERLADIGGCHVEYLRSRITEGVSLERVPMRILNDFKCREDSVFWFIGPVVDIKDDIKSGVIEEIR